MTEAPMKTQSMIGICISVALSVPFVRGAAVGQEPQARPSITVHQQPTLGDELHFVNVLTFRGEVVTVDSANSLVTLKDPNGRTSTLEVRSQKDLESIAVGDHVVGRYVEGGSIGSKRSAGAVAIDTFNNGLIATVPGQSRKKQAFIASVGRLDRAEQEITLKGPDGSLETIMVANPEHLGHVKVGDKVVITHAEALALSLKKES